MDKASILQGSHVTWRPWGLALKNPASCSLLLRVAYRVAPIPGVLTAPSVMIHNSSSGRGGGRWRASGKGRLSNSIRGGLEGAVVPNPAQDHSRFGVDDSFGSGEFEEVALGEGLEHSFPVVQ